MGLLGLLGRLMGLPGLGRLCGLRAEGRRRGRGRPCPCLGPGRSLRLGPCLGLPRLLLADQALQPPLFQLALDLLLDLRGKCARGGSMFLGF